MLLVLRKSTWKAIADYSLYWVGTSSRAPTGGRVLEGVIKLPLSPPQARKFWRYGL